MFAVADKNAVTPVVDIEIERQYSAGEIGKAIRQIVVEVVAQHPKNLYVEGAALINQADEFVLLVGTTRVGKSTLSAALALGLGWKVLSEDLVLFDLSNKYVLSLKLPISLRSGATKLIEDTTGFKPETKGTDDIWLPINYALPTKREAKFDRVFLLEAPYKTEVVCSELLPEQAVRLMLPASNAIHFAEGIDHIMATIERARCFRISGGTLKRRIDIVSYLDLKTAQVTL